MTPRGNEPSSWSVAHYANIGTKELFVSRFLHIPVILDASMIFDPQRAEAKSAITEIMTEGLMPAFEHLRRIRTHTSEPPPEMNRRQDYEDFMGTLWQGYKNFLPQATEQLGFKIGFLFQKDAKFEEGLLAFRDAYPAVSPELLKLFRFQRSGWQGQLARFRNEYVEHRQLTLADVRKFYGPREAENFFEAAWTSAEDILVALIASKLAPNLAIHEIPESERNPARPDRFGFHFIQPMREITTQG
jgi:hypothetical protein